MAHPGSHYPGPDRRPAGRTARRIAIVLAAVAALGLAGCSDTGDQRDTLTSTAIFAETSPGEYVFTVTVLNASEDEVVNVSLTMSGFQNGEMVVENTYLLGVVPAETARIFEVSCSGCPPGITDWRREVFRV